jgi:hypothetical protein
VSGLGNLELVRIGFEAFALKSISSDGPDWVSIEEEELS